MVVDEVLKNLGRFGPWQILLYCGFAASTLGAITWQILSTIFIGATPQHHCNVNSSLLPLVIKNGKWTIDSCKIYNSSSPEDNTTIECNNGWKYDYSYGTSIVTEWNLVCSDGWLAEFSQTVFIFGMALGSLTLTFLADKLGRKPIFLISHLILAIASVIAAFSINYFMFAVMRMVQGISTAGVLFSGILLMFELFPASRRTIAGSLSQVFFASGMMVMLLLAYCIRNWRHFQLALGLIPAVTLSGYWLCPESIPWLVANDRTEEAVRVLNQAAKCNRISLDLSPLTDSRKKRSGSNDASSAIDDASNHDICQVLRHPISRKYVFIMFILWFVNSLVYFGLSFTTTMLTGNRYLNFFLNALIELPALLVCLFFLQRFGRRVPLCSFHVISGIVLIISVFVPRETGNGTNLEPLLVTLSMIGKTFITASFDTMYIYTPEIFPTNVRNFGMGTSNLAARVGAMLAPFSVNIARIIPWVPAVVFGSTSIFAGGLALYMPETLRTPLPQTLKEVIEWKQENPFLCCFSSYSVSSETTAILSKGTAAQESEIVNPTYQSNSDITYDANS